MSVIDDIIDERRNKLQVKYIERALLDIEIENMINELRYFEKKKDIETGKLVSLFTGKEY